MHVWGGSSASGRRGTRNTAGGIGGDVGWIMVGARGSRQPVAHSIKELDIGQGFPRIELLKDDQQQNARLWGAKGVASRRDVD